MELLTFIGCVVLLFMVLDLRGRIQSLEQRLKNEALPLAPASNLTPITTAVEIQPASVPAQPVEYSPTWVDRFIDWIKEDWLLKLGAFILLVGFGWFASYAFLNNWIGPMGRIGLGLLAGVLILILGWWRIQKYTHQGGVFLVLGSTTILLTLFAAREIYNFFTPLTALIGMFLSTVIVAVASVKFKSRSLALCSLILAGIAPFFTSSPTQDYVALFVYLLVVVLGVIWIVLFSGWRELNAASLALVTLYSLPHLTGSSVAPIGTLLILAYLFGALFLITNIIGILRSTGKDLSLQLATAAGTSIFLLAWVMQAAPGEWKSLIIGGWALLYVAAAFLTWHLTNRREPFYVYGGAAIMLLAAALSLELHGTTLVIAYAVEAVVATIVSYLTLKDLKKTQITSFLLFWPSALSLESLISPDWAYGVFHKDFFALLIIGLTWLGLGYFFVNRNQQEGEKEKVTTAFYFAIGSIFLYVLLWLSLHSALLNNNLAVMIALVVYTVIGIATYLFGVRNEKKAWRAYGGVLIGAVVLRLFTIDIWDMELTGRIIIFFLVGTLLVSTAFVGRKKV